MRREDSKEQQRYRKKIRRTKSTILAGRENELNKIYIVSTICNIIVNFDHGIIPACTKNLKNELQIDDFFLGVLGSMVFTGLMSGSLISGYLFTIYSCKKLILISLVMIILSVTSFCIFSHIRFLLILSRLVCGFFQVFLVVYYPVWVDFFAEEKKTIWLTYLQIGVPFGVFLGYGITAMFNILNQTYPFIDVSFLKFCRKFLEISMILKFLTFLDFFDNYFCLTLYSGDGHFTSNRFYLYHAYYSTCPLIESCLQPTE